MIEFIVAAIDFGSVVDWVVVLGIVLVAWVFWRGGGGTAIVTLQAANRVLEERVQVLTDENKQLSRELAELKGRTDVALALTPVLKSLQHHEEQATKRSEAMLAVLDLIAERLGPDKDDG